MTAEERAAERNNWMGRNLDPLARLQWATHLSRLDWTWYVVSFIRSLTGWDDIEVEVVEEFARVLAPYFADFGCTALDTPEKVVRFAMQRWPHARGNYRKVRLSEPRPKAVEVFSGTALSDAEMYAEACTECAAKMTVVRGPRGAVRHLACPNCGRCIRRKDAGKVPWATIPTFP